MKTIQIKSLSLVNFKGIKKLEISDFQKETNIFGQNGTGKTSIFDAFTWLLFGKDSSDRTNFEIKTLDKLNNVIPKIEHEVEALIDVDGEAFKLKRTFREKWAKRRGSLEAEFGGNETMYEWNDVPVTAGEFTSKISTLVEESVFKLITSPTAFNSLKWQEQRQVLIDISGGVTDQDVAKGNSEFELLLSKLGTKTIADYEKQIKASIRKSKEEIKMIPSRIDEVERGKPEAIDFNEVERDLQANQKELEAIDNQISDKVTAQQEVLNKRSEIQREIHKLESEIEDEKHILKLKAKTKFQEQSSVIDDINSKFDNRNEELSKTQRLLNSIEQSIKNSQKDIQDLKDRNDEIRNQWNARNAEEFHMDEDSCKCPTCKRDFETEDIETKKKELFANFQQQKMKDMEGLSSRGKKNSGSINEIEAELKTLNQRKEKGLTVVEGFIQDLEELESALSSAQDNTNIKSEVHISNEFLKDSKVISGKIAEINTFESSLQDVQSVDVQDLKDKKQQYVKQIEAIKSRLSTQDQIKQANSRIDSLQKEESQLAQQIADYELDQFVIENFTKAKIDTLENLINKRFEFVNFKLFELQVNGGEVPTCKALINGVPFSDANTASRINAGIDIINTLCNFYNVSAPIFVDNRESVTKLIDSQSQIVSLIVSDKDKKLRVESESIVLNFDDMMQKGSKMMMGYLKESKSISHE
jgi:hypothetical protein